MVSELKNKLRKEMLAKRDAMGQEEMVNFSDIIANSVLSDPSFKEANTVAVYIEKGSEVKTRKIITEAVGLGKKIVLPVTREQLSFHCFTSFSDLAQGKFGILEPTSTAPHPSEPDLILIPGVAFGLCMHRLGYGKGYYDRYLMNSTAYRLGICYDFQVLKKLPSHHSDQNLDKIITEKRTISPSQKL